MPWKETCPLEQRVRADRPVDPSSQAPTALGASKAPCVACTRVAPAVWCVDFKGYFRMQDGERCHPLTLTDAYSRLLLRCEAALAPDARSVRPVFESAFREFGLPNAIRSDNGAPFASTGAGGLTPLSVWWIKLGIAPERIEPGKPQQNGRHEQTPSRPWSIARERSAGDAAATSSPPACGARR